MRVRLIIDYDYGGDEVTPPNIALSELADWMAGNVTIADFMAVVSEEDKVRVEVLDEDGVVVAALDGSDIK